MQRKLKVNLLRYFALKTIDSYLISFPKSGRTWLRIVFKQYVRLISNNDEEMASLCILPGEPKAPGLRLLRKPFPIIKLTHDVGEEVNGKLLRFDEMEKWVNPRQYFYKRNIYLFRDPRDVLVSYFYQKALREPLFGKENKEISRDINDFAKNPTYGLPKIVQFMNLWLPICKEYPQWFYPVNYEKIRKDPFNEFLNIFEYLGVKGDSNFLKQALEFGSLSAAQKREIDETKKKGVSIEGQENARKFRKGIVGGYVDELPQELLGYVDSYVNDALDPCFKEYGYIK